MRCITLREFREKYLDGTCDACRRTVEEVIRILGLKDDDLVTIVTVACCAMTEGGTCGIPLPCPHREQKQQHTNNTQCTNLLCGHI